MTPVLPSASGLYIASECDGSFALPQVSDSVSVESRTGDIIHDFLERAMPGDRDAALDLVPVELRARCAAINLTNLTSLFESPPAHEVTYGWNAEADVGKEFGRSLKRDYSSVPRGWMVGTADAVSVTADHVVVGDWKSGASFQEHPSANIQLRFLALAAARANHVASARAIIVVIGDDDDGWPKILSADFDEMDLDSIAHEVRTIRSRVLSAQADVAAGRTPPLTIGSFCRYCKALPGCPAFVGASQILVPLADRTLTMTPAQIGEQWAAAGALQIALDRFESAVRFQVERGLRVPLPNGQELRATQVKSRTISGKIVLDVLREKGMEPAFLTATKVTLAGIEKVCGDRAVEVLAEIEKQGGISTSTHTQVRALKPLKDAKP